MSLNKSENINRILDERESSILRAIVYEYITTGKPVGSRSFVQKYSLSISPATIRNIMFDLESIGYLVQPHTSAGRTPTDLGYRFYVDALLDSYDFSMNKNVSVREDILTRELQLDRVFQSLIKMLSSVSNYAGVMLTPKTDYTVLKRIDLVSLDEEKILGILVTRTGMIINKKVTISDRITQDILYEFSKYLTGELCGYALYEIRNHLFRELRDSKKNCAANCELAIDIAELALGDRGESDLIIDGIEKLLRIPEMVEERRLNSLLNIIEEKNILRTIMEKLFQKDGVRILIGKEIEEERVSGCSMVATTYKIGNNNVGVIGVLGPTRMDYEKVVPLVDYTGRVISEFLTGMSK